MNIFGVTHPGKKRKNNEDQYFTQSFDEETHLMVLADGMGGQVGGEHASKIACDTFNAFTVNTIDTLSQLINLAINGHNEILKTIFEKPELFGMGTTVVAAFIKNNTVQWASVGDSRLYHFSKGALTQITVDHTIPGMLLKKKQITSEQAEQHPLKNALVKCLGCRQADPDSGEFNVAGGDLIFMCSDGLYDEVSDQDILSILNKRANLKKTLNEFVKAALNAGGADNITVVGIEI